jgi:hypothetical protein
MTKSKPTFCGCCENAWMSTENEPATASDEQLLQIAPEKMDNIA